MDNIIGKKLDGRYEIQEIIGVGGMAIVYKAYDSIDDRIVAVKVLKEEYLSNEDFKRRFKNESKAIAVLSHPNIVKVYDVSLSEKLQYIVMEYIDGITLKEYIDQQHVLTWKEAVHFTVQILRALQHAHEKGIVHRDIKPQNIMMLEDGTIKVADFGIARFANSETRTMTDKAIGSVHYISPEQARGADTDEKSDIYSVGVMLFEMLTGQLPFESENAVSVAIMQMQQEPKKPREINDKIPEGLEDITLRAMQKEPLQRYPSAAEMLLDIEEFKRNPSIHFEYKYFIDDNPTKYVEAINRSKGQPEKADGKGAQKAKKASVIPILSGVAAVVLIITLVLIVGALWVFGFFKSSADITVPNFIGKQYSQVATDKTYTKNFTIVKTNQEYNAKPEGTIIAQTPDADSPAKTGSEVKVTISLGPKMATVPKGKVVGQTQSDAQVALQNAGFTYTPQMENNPTVAKGTVISCNPGEGTQAIYGSNVTIVVSLGPAVTNVPVPPLAGKTFDSGTISDALQQAGLKLGTVTHQWSSSVDLGAIISTSPNGGSSALQNSAVNVVVSSGPEPTQNFLQNQISDVLSSGYYNSYLNNGNGIIIIITDQATNTKYTIRDTQDEQSFSTNHSSLSNDIIVLQSDNANTPEVDFTIAPSSTSSTGSGGSQ
jgi:serine/threonine-protein kinase